MDQTVQTYVESAITSTTDEIVRSLQGTEAQWKYMQENNFYLPFRNLDDWSDYYNALEEELIKRGYFDGKDS